MKIFEIKCENWFRRLVFPKRGKFEEENIEIKAVFYFVTFTGKFLWPRMNEPSTLAKRTYIQ